jgi:predicted dehydrogenase
MNTLPTRIALIGPGRHAQEHLIDLLLANPRVNLTALVGRDLGRLESIARQYNISHVSDSWQSFISRDTCDAVIVSSTPELHAAVLSHTIALGLPTMIEKPPAPNLESLLNLVKLQAHYRTTSMVDYNIIYSRAFRYLLSLVPSHLEILQLKVSMFANKPRLPLWNQASTTESLLYAVGIHGLALINHVAFGASVISTSRTQFSSDRELINVRLKSPSGCNVLFEIGNHHQFFELLVELIDSDSNIYILKNLETITTISSGTHGTNNLSPKQATNERVYGILSSESRGGYGPAIAHFIDQAQNDPKSGANLSWSIPIFTAIDEILSQV